jgi:hypothetical protein
MTLSRLKNQSILLRIAENNDYLRVTIISC